MYHLQVFIRYYRSINIFRFNQTETKQCQRKKMNINKIYEISSIGGLVYKWWPCSLSSEEGFQLVYCQICITSDLLGLTDRQILSKHTGRDISKSRDSRNSTENLVNMLKRLHYNLYVKITVYNDGFPENKVLCLLQFYITSMVHLQFFNNYIKLIHKLH